MKEEIMKIDSSANIWNKISLCMMYAEEFLVEGNLFQTNKNQ